MGTKEDVATWLNDNLSEVLSFPVPQDLIQYIMSIENGRDVEDYLKTLLDFNNPSHKLFWENYKVIRHFKNGIGEKEKVPQPKEKGKKGKNARQKEEKSNKPAEKTLSPQMEKLTLNPDEEGGKPGKKKKKERYVNLYSAEGAGCDVILLKGRHHCDCQAAKHRLVNNCLKCGRIVCAQEGSGPCLYCGNLVCSKEEQEFINARTTQSKKLFDNLMEAGRPEGWEEAVKHRDRLLEYDRTTQSRTKVIDDEGEYFSASSVWLSPAEKEKLAKREEDERRRKHASRLEVKFTLDFAGRQIIEDQYNEPEFEEDEVAEVDYAPTSAIQPDLAVDFRPEFVSNTESTVKSGKGVSGMKNRVQDRQLQEMSDTGACLSMHQPWASLLVHGIKRHEGRNWYSAHRGRLWIAAAAKQPADEDIAEWENFYRSFRPGEDLEFPKNYPTSCLLGCVTVTDVLSQEEYQNTYHVPESDSPFVFICEDFRPLSLKFPMSGQHKIYKLDLSIHKAAQKAMLRTTRVDG